MFLANRGLSRWGKMKGEERDLCWLQTSFLSCKRSHFLNNQWEPRTGLNLSVSASGCWIFAHTQIWNGPIRVEDETPFQAAVVADPITRLWGKPNRRILRHIFVFHESSTAKAHMELLILLWFGTFLFEEKVICGVTSGLLWMEWFSC